MADCCEDKSCALEGLQTRQRGTLKTVPWINAAMFVAASAAGIYASSSALLADSLDNLGDALTYLAWRRTGPWRCCRSTAPRT